MNTSTETTDTCQKVSIEILEWFSKARKNETFTSKNNNEDEEKKTRRNYKFFDFSFGTWFRTLPTIYLPLIIILFIILIMKNNQDIITAIRSADFQIAQWQREADQMRSYETGNATVFTNYLKTFADMFSILLSSPNSSPIYIQSLTSSTLPLLSQEKKQQLFFFLYQGYYLKWSIPNNRNSLRYSNLDNLNLNYHNFVGMRLAGACLVNISFVGSALNFSFFSQVTMMGANFSKTKLNKVFFDESDLSQVDFTGSKWNKIVFRKVNLTGAIISDELLFQALSFEDTILPNGTLAEQTSLVNNGDGSDGLKDWSVKGDVRVFTDSRSNLTYFYIGNNASMRRRLNVTKYQVENLKSACCISLQYTNRITVTLRFNTSYYFSTENVFKLDELNGRQSEHLGFFSWSGCYNYDGTHVSSIDLLLSISETNNKSNASKIRSIKLSLSYDDWFPDEA